jgi:hypothetical protein
MNQIKKWRKFMRTTFRILMVAFVLTTFLPCNMALAWGDKEPAAIIVDNETCEPVEGVIALATWSKHSITKRAWWEGGTWYTARAVEVGSDAGGRIFIPGYWGWRPFAGKRRLTLYKPGYALWDSNFDIYWEHRDPSEFNAKQRIIRMQRFDDTLFQKLAEKFPGAKYPYTYHHESLGLYTFGINLYGLKLESRLLAAFRKHEQPFQVKEQDQINIENEQRNRENYQRAIEKFNKSRQQEGSK